MKLLLVNLKMPAKSSVNEGVASATPSVFVPPRGIDFWINDGDTEKCIENAVKQWAAWYPDEVKQFKRDQERDRAQLAKEGGMSKERSMKRLIEVPTNLHNIVSNMLGTNQWAHSREDRGNNLTRELQLLIKHCPMILVNKRKISERSVIT